MGINRTPISEQEVVINFMRDEGCASIYTSDSTWITKLDKLCETNPEMYKVKERSAYSCTYYLADKTLISLRKKKKEMSEEQRKKASERFIKMREEGKL